MYRLLAYASTLSLSALAYAAEDVPDAPPDSLTSWIGLAIFLLIVAGGAVWFYKAVLKHDSNAGKAGKP